MPFSARATHVCVDGVRRAYAARRRRVTARSGFVRACKIENLPRRFERGGLPIGQHARGIE